MRCASDSWPHVPDWTDDFPAMTTQQAQDTMAGIALIAMIAELVKPPPPRPRRWWRRSWEV